MFRIIILVFMHAAADFLLQGSTLSKLKASKTAYLFAHVGIYTAFFMIFSPVVLGLTILQGLLFSSINGFAHLVIDFVTIRLRNRYWQKNETSYFAVIVLDQALHIAILVGFFLSLYPGAAASGF